MPALKTKAISLLSSTSVDMKTVGATALYTVPVGRTLRITHAVVRDISASLAGGTSYSITGFVATFSLAAVTGGAGTAYAVVSPTNNTGYTENAAAVTVNWTVTTGSTAACTAVIDLFGFLA